MKLTTSVRQVSGRSGILRVPLLCEQCGRFGRHSDNTLLTEQWHTATP